MSLDVRLYQSDADAPKGSGIFVRENGKSREISREEWDKKFPGLEPVVVVTEDPTSVYHDNITHNLNQMADAAGLYLPLWRPEEMGASKAHQLIESLRTGLEMLKAEPGRFQTFNPSNGWGNYEGLVEFVEGYLKACQEYPDADVYASR
jgi:hypothetical protein